MATKKVRILDFGRGPQIEENRLTVMDVFYYIHRGYDFEFIHQALPGLEREQFDAVVDYIHEHNDELVERDRRADEFHRRSMQAQHARGGLFAETDKIFTTAERVARLKEKLRRKLAEENGAGHPG